MKLDPGMHIGLHLVFFGKTGVTGGQPGGRPGALIGNGCQIITVTDVGGCNRR
jgi:hypothetical protein